MQTRFQNISWKTVDFLGSWLGITPWCPSREPTTYLQQYPTAKHTSLVAKDWGEIVIHKVNNNNNNYSPSVSSRAMSALCVITNFYYSIKNGSSCLLSWTRGPVGLVRDEDGSAIHKQQTVALYTNYWNAVSRHALILFCFIWFWEHIQRYVISQ